MSITTLGRVHIASRIASSSPQNRMVYMAIGTGTPTATALGNEVSRKFFTESELANVITYLGHWDADDDLAANITEAGIFNVDNTMLCSATFGTISKDIFADLLITWALTV